tara:strand:+ start:120 stop:1148 length:1029 start_codon:yes stop_codon:yes gene_type:complete
MGYKPNKSRYTKLEYNRCGKSGLLLPPLSLGLWHNFGGSLIKKESKKIILSSFDLGITHFDLANNYGPPPGSAEINFGRVLAKELKNYRDEIIISTKAGYDMWDGPYGEWSSKKYLMSSLDQSLHRMNLDYVDIFYSHRFDPNTPLEETVEALAQIVNSGKALYIGISSYSSLQTKKINKLLNKRGVRCLIHQPSYSMLNRWIENDLLNTLEQEGMGCIIFSPLAQGMLSTKYLKKISQGSRAAEKNSFINKQMITNDYRSKVKSLGIIAKKRNQTLPQMAIAWCLRDKRVTSVVFGVRNIKQLKENIMALKNIEFDKSEIDEINKYATDSNINIWKDSSAY